MCSATPIGATCYMPTILFPVDALHPGTHALSLYWLKKQSKVVGFNVLIKG